MKGFSPEQDRPFGNKQVIRVGFRPKPSQKPAETDHELNALRSADGWEHCPLIWRVRTSLASAECSYPGLGHITEKQIEKTVFRAVPFEYGDHTMVRAAPWS
jgi:hypothetical protein